MSNSPAPQITGPGKVTPDLLRWEQKLEDEQFNALQTVRGVAEKWTASLGAIIGLASAVLIVKGREDIGELALGFQIVVAVLLLLAFVGALAATVLAAYAAQGTPTELKWPTAEKVRDAEHAAAMKAKGRLRKSRELALVVACLMAIAVAFTWFGETKDESPSPSVLFTESGGALECGTLGRSDDGALQVTSGKEKAVPFAPGEGSAVVVVPSCPK
jgi:hypothetical protein